MQYVYLDTGTEEIGGEVNYIYTPVRYTCEEQHKQSIKLVGWRIKNKLFSCEMAAAVRKTQLDAWEKQMGISHI